MPETAPPTPLIEQYEGVKTRYPGHLVLFRVGDFYETFGEDAKLLARELEIVLTARAPDERGERLPMAGVPHHAVETYLSRLVRKGYKVAICDQVEDARFAKGLVRREVTRVVTPGTVVEDRILASPDHNFLAAVELAVDQPSVFAVVDVTTGEWIHGTAPFPGIDGAVAALAPYQPREILIAADAAPDRESRLLAGLKQEFPSARLETAPTPTPVEELPKSLAGLLTEPAAVARVGRRLAAYVRTTQPRLLPYLTPLEEEGRVRRMLLDAKTLRHLEISRPMNPDDPKGTTLLDVFDATVTAPGRRTLSFWLKTPIAEVEAIVHRQEAVQALLDRHAQLLVLRSNLARVADLSRIGARLASRRVRPPELGALRESLHQASAIVAWVGEGAATPLLDRLRKEAEPPQELVDRLDQVLPDTMPLSESDRGLFRPGLAPELDALVAQERAAIAALDALERREQERSGIRALKVGYNQVFGYYFEVSRPNLARVPSHFRRKQTLAGGERFTTDELAEIEQRLLTARDSAGTTETQLWERFLGEVEHFLPRIHRVSRALGALDALGSFALLAQERGFVRPTVDDSGRLVIREGRHAVLDRLQGGRFVPNDADLDAATSRLMVLTGPNMSGKSTYMRQVGLLVVLAQAGAFVPAKFARIGLVSSLFTRMGFTDEIGRGKSSFMVEMSEVAEILRSADGRSLVLLDEVGRGTSTFDGLALAWAILRHLHDVVRCRSILATHYYQLTELVGTLPAAVNAHLAVDERDGEVTFLHHVVPGSTDRSYGVHVARLAGIPPPVLAEAERLLRQLEARDAQRSAGPRGARVTPRYTQAILLPSETARAPSELDGELRRLAVDTVTPLEALQKLHEWKRRLDAPDPPDGP